MSDLGNEIIRGLAELRDFLAAGHRIEDWPGSRVLARPSAGLGPCRRCGATDYEWVRIRGIRLGDCSECARRWEV